MRILSTLLAPAAAAGILALTLAGTAVPSAAATTVPAPGGVTATVGVDADGVLQPGQDLQLSVSVTNSTTRTLTDARVSVSLDESTLDSRTELSEWLSGETESDGDPLGDGTDLRLLPSSSAQLSITVPAAAIPFVTDPEDAAGTHALEVTVTADGESVATGRNTLEWWTGQPVPAPIGVSVVVPLIAPESIEGLIPADDLATYTEVTGTLTRQLDSVDGRGVAIAIDPRIIASIRILGPAAPASAVAWLQRLETVPNEKFALQYGDADVSAQAQSGLPALLGPTSFEYGIGDDLFATVDPAASATPAEETPADGADSAPGGESDQQPRPTLESLTAYPYTPQLGSLAWPAPGTVRGADLAVYTASGMSRTLVSSADLDLPRGVDTATTAAVDGGAVVIADDALSRAFDDAVAADTDARWRAAITTLASEAAQAQRSDSAQPVVIAVDRTAAASGYRLSQTLDALAALPWADSAPLSATLSTPETDDVTVVDAPESADRLAVVARILQQSTAVESFARVLDDPALITGRYRNDALALLDVSRIGDPSGWTAAVDERLAAAESTLADVTIVAPSSVLQVSRDSSIPVYVRNDLPWPVTVVLRASTSNAVLDIDESTVETTSIDGRSQGRVFIPVKARVGNGETRLYLQVTAVDGTAIGAPASILANVRADWETVGTLVVGIVLVLVFGLGIGRNILRRRRSGGIDDDEPDPNSPLADQPTLGPPDDIDTPNGSLPRG